MSDQLSYDEILKMTKGMTLDQVADLVKKDSRLSGKIRFDTPPPLHSVAGASDDCAFWVKDPANGWVCGRQK